MCSQSKERTRSCGQFMLKEPLWSYRHKNVEGFDISKQRRKSSDPPSPNPYQKSTGSLRVVFGIYILCSPVESSLRYNLKLLPFIGITNDTGNVWAM